jgi:hypothetical protein
MRLIYNSDAQRLQKDFDDKTPTSVSEMLRAERTSSVPLELFLVDNDGGYTTPGTSDYEVVIGRSAQKLTTGLLKLTWTGTTEAIDLSKPKLATRIESALNAVSEIDTAGGVDVVELTNGRGYQITFRSVGSRAAITAGVSESMQPATATLTEVTAGDLSTKEVQLLTLEEASLAEVSTGSWSASSAPALTISTLVAGTSSTREVQKLSISGDPAPGSFFVVSDSEPISTEATAAQVKTILNSALSSDIGSVKKTGEREWQVTYKTNGDKTALSAGTHNLVRRPGISATLSLNTTALAYASNSDGSDLSIGFTLRKSNEVIISEKISLSEPFAEVLGSTAMLTNDSIGALFKIDSNEINKGQAITISGGLTYNGSTHDLAAPFLPLAGGTMTGAVAMGSQKITGLADGTASGDALNKGQLDALIDGSPDNLNTLNELAEALNDDEAFSVTVTNNIATKLPLAGGTMTGAILNADGSAAAPSISFSSDTDTGLYYSSNTIYASFAGSAAWLFKADYIGSSSSFAAMVTKAAGSAASPSYSFMSDTDTGIFRVAADQLGISTGGTERVHVYDDGFDFNNLSVNFKDSGGDGRATLGLASQHFAINVYGTSGWINNAINIDNDTGHVGINNDSPAQKLDVIGRIRSSYNDGDYFEIGSSDSGGFVIGKSGGTEKVNIRTYGDSYFNGGNVGIGTDSPSANLDITSSLNQQHLYIQGALDSGSTALARLKTISNGNVLLLESATTSDSREIFDVKNSNGSVFKIQGDGASVFSGAVNLPDDVKLKLGTSSDLQLYSDNSNTIIDSYNCANMLFRQHYADGDMTFQCDDSNGNVETYFFLDGSANTSGYPRTIFPDDSTLNFGTDMDLRITHMAGASYIFNLTATDFYVTQQGADKDIIFSTTTGGSTSELMRLDGSASSINVPDDVKLKIGSGGDLQLQHSSGHSYLENSTGHLYINNHGENKMVYFRGDDGTGSGVTEYFRVDGDEEKVIFSKPITVEKGNTDAWSALSDVDDKSALRIKPISDSSASFWFGGFSGGARGIQIANGDGTGSYDLILNPFGGNVGIGTTSPAAPLDVTGSINLSGELNFSGNGNKNLDVYTLADSNAFKIRHHNPSGNLFENAAVFTANAGAELYYNHDKTFETLSDGIKVTGAMALTETTTPTATADVGKVYTKSDNKLYFQDGAGTEHEIAFA